MSDNFILQMEVAGCPTVCMHCWAQGAPYNAMPVGDIQWVLEGARTFCDVAGFELIAYPMHEVAVHPQAVEVLDLFQKIVSPYTKFVDPLPTTGVPLALRDDWSQLLDGLHDLGITTLFFAFHGVGEVHDRAVNRAGAYAETCLAARRALSKGLKVGANVFVTKELVPQIEELAATLDELGIGSYWEVARYSPVARVRRYEQLRPAISDLLPMAAEIAQRSALNSDVWNNLGDYTEAAYMRKALCETGAEFDYLNRSDVRLVCRCNLDVHVGDAKLYGPLLGNLRKDGAQAVFSRAVEHGAISDDVLHFPHEVLPSVSELAKAVGDPQGQSIYFEAASIRYRWLDLFLRKSER